MIDFSRWWVIPPQWTLVHVGKRTLHIHMLFKHILSNIEIKINNEDDKLLHKDIIQTIKNLLMLFMCCFNKKPIMKFSYILNQEKKIQCYLGKLIYVSMCWKLNSNHYSIWENMMGEYYGLRMKIKYVLLSVKKWYPLVSM